MSTHSNILFENKDKSITSLYVSFDGYLSGVGLTLHQSYNDVDKIKELVELGYASSLEHTVSETREVAVNQEAPERFSNLDDYMDNYKTDPEFIYLWRSGSWFVCDIHGVFNMSSDTFVPLRKVLSKRFTS